MEVSKGEYLKILEGFDVVFSVAQTLPLASSDEPRFCELVKLPSDWRKWLRNLLRFMRQDWMTWQVNPAVDRKRRALK
jgi:hypothetical protein